MTTEQFKEYYDYYDSTASIIYTYDPNEKGIKGTLYKWGSRENIEKVYKTAYPILSKIEPVYIVHNVPIEDVIKMIEYTGWVGTWHEKRESELFIIEVLNQ